MTKKIKQLVMAPVVYDRLLWLAKEDGCSESVAIRSAINAEYARRTGSAPSDVIHRGRPKSATKPTQDMKITEMTAMTDEELTKYIHEIGYCVVETMKDGRIKRYWIGRDDVGQRVLWQGYFYKLEDTESYHRDICWNFAEMIAEMKKTKHL